VQEFVSLISFFYRCHRLAFLHRHPLILDCVISDSLYDASYHAIQTVLANIAPHSRFISKHRTITANEVHMMEFLYLNVVVAALVRIGLLTHVAGYGFNLFTLDGFCEFCSVYHAATSPCTRCGCLG
jgi:hypothetical protein